MNTIVDKLLNVDKEARKNLDEAQEYYETTISETKAELEKMKKDYDRQLRHYIEETDQSFKDESTTRVQAIEQKKTALLQTMDHEFEAHHQQWQDTIFARCIARK